MYSDRKADISAPPPEGIFAAQRTNKILMARAAKLHGVFQLRNDAGGPCTVRSANSPKLSPGRHCPMPTLAASAPSGMAIGSSHLPAANACRWAMSPADAVDAVIAIQSCRCKASGIGSGCRLELDGCCSPWLHEDCKCVARHADGISGLDIVGRCLQQAPRVHLNIHIGSYQLSD